MTAEWSLDVDEVTDSNGNNPATKGNAANTIEYAKYAQEWRYFNSVDDGARVSKGWFKVCLLYTSHDLLLYPICHYLNYVH